MKIKNPDSIKSLMSLLSNLEIYDFDIESSKKAAEIFDYLKTRGEIIDLADIMIASIAIEHNESLLTQNTSHFKRIPNLRIEEIN